MMKTKMLNFRCLKASGGKLRACLLSAAAIGVAGAQTNTTTGTGAGSSITSGQQDSAFGYGALKKNTKGSLNTAVGSNAMLNNKVGSFNTAIGSGALKTNTGSSNVAMGFEALFKNKNGQFNVAIGDGAMKFNVSGSNNVALGMDAGSLTDGSDNILIDHFGVAGESGKIHIGTPGTHTNTFIAGMISGDGSGLTGINAATLTGQISGSQIAPASVTSTNLASNLTLGGTTSGIFSGNLAGTAANAENIVSSDRRMTLTNTGTFGQAFGFSFDSGANGLLIETNAVGESAGLFLNGNTAVIYSPGDQDILRVFDEDNMTDVSPVPAFKVLNINAGIQTPGKVFLGTPQVSAVGGVEDLKIIRGTVNSLGAITRGSGFSVATGSTGIRTITFSSAFSSAPSVTCTLAGTLGHIVGNFPGGATTTSYEVFITNSADVATNAGFDFIAIGPR